MTTIIIALVVILISLALLSWSADRFIMGASAVAQQLGASPLVIGLTIVAFGTSAPEMVVSALAALNQAPGLAIGNAIGSNITNIGLVLGFTALFAPLSIHSALIKREIPLLILISLLAGFLLLNGYLSRLDGIILIVSLGLFIAYLALVKQKEPLLNERSETEVKITASKAWFSLIIGLILLLVSSRALVWSGVNLATAFGVSDLIIGLTIVAIGTSLPELAATLASALKKQTDMAIGTVIGSNIFNLLGVLALPGLLAPGPLEANVAQRDMPTMLGFTLVFGLMAWFAYKGRGIGRLFGALLVSGYLIYMGWLIIYP
jgi:cation:H+ antiporter